MLFVPVVVVPDWITPEFAYVSSICTYPDVDIVGAHSSMGSSESRAYLDYWHVGTDKAKYAQGDMSKLLTYLGYPVTLAPSGVENVALSPFPLS